MSKTPLTDAAVASTKRAHGKAYEFVSIAFARKLETDRAELVEMLKLALDTDHMDEDDPLFVSSRERIRALLARLEADK